MKCPSRCDREVFAVGYSFPVDQLGLYYWTHKQYVDGYTLSRASVDTSDSDHGYCCSDHTNNTYSR